MAVTAFYAGSFDPPTNGHADILRRGLKLVDHLVVAIGIHPGKTPLFTVEARKAMLEAITAPSITPGKTITITTFDGLTVDAARHHGATILLRGLRDGTDLDYEMQLAGMNGSLDCEIETVFLPSSPITRPITATLVRQIAAMGGDVSAFVPQNVLDALQHRYPSHVKTLT
jgi:pantetheine-phosphate adenylyltransferase